MVTHTLTDATTETLYSGTMSVPEVRTREARDGVQDPIFRSCTQVGKNLADLNSGRVFESAVETYLSSSRYLYRGWGLGR